MLQTKYNTTQKSTYIQLLNINFNISQSDSEQLSSNEIVFKNIKSPLRYPGGKSKIIKEFIKYIPNNFKELREPFFGGGSFSLFYSLSSKIKIKASDLNEDVYLFWYYLKNNPIDFISEIKRIKQTYFDGRILYNEIIERRKNGNIDNYQKAIDFYVLNRITFSGTIYSGGYSEESFQKRFTDSIIDKLLFASVGIKNINIANEDYSKLLNNNGKDVFIYVDPPYYGNRHLNLYGKNDSFHKHFDHIRLFKKLSSCKHKWLITYDDNQFIRELYKDYNIYDLNFHYGMKSISLNKIKKGKEVIITNYKK